MKLHYLTALKLIILEYLEQVFVIFVTLWEADRLEVILHKDTGYNGGKQEIFRLLKNPKHPEAQKSETKSTPIIFPR